jgi:cell division protein FtsI/penicillin-binding protein 2
MIGALVEAVASGRTRLRRARNLRAATRARPSVQPSVQPSAQSSAHARPSARVRGPAPLRWLTAGCVLLALAGAVLIVMHARWLAAAGATPPGDGAARFQAMLPGIAFTVPDGTGTTVHAHGAATLVIVSGMRAGPVKRIDLCEQLADRTRPGRLLSLRIGWPFAAVAGLDAPRNVLLADQPMPRVRVDGRAAPDLPPLALRWEGDAKWTDGATTREGTDGTAALRGEGWLAWRDGALRLQRRASAACPLAGELLVHLYRPAPAPQALAQALVIALPAQGDPIEARLAPGDYKVPASAGPALEDEQLFQQLSARGLVRLGANGLAELAPPDLAAWRAAGPTPWDRVRLDGDTLRLLERLYRRADGDFVREQVRIFNAERRLLAWRMADGAQGTWRAEVTEGQATAPVPLADDMPPSSARLFARLPQGWGPWQRVGAWPADGSAARLRLQLAAPARAGESLRLMLAGRVTHVAGARLRGAPQPGCDGRACRAPDEVQVLDLAPDPGTQEIVLDAAPLALDALATPGDARYRHLVVRDGQLAWQALGPAAARAPALVADVALADRNGVPLWRDGAPTEAARAAGLATMLGVRASQPGSIAAMLGRLPGASHTARLTLDLRLQAVAQAALDCIAMRRGRWDGAACSGAGQAPAGRQAGIVLLDTETGAILAAAGAGMPAVDAANWREARDFDRIDPAASPLRLPALQHDGGAERSPGSTFKVVSALGLELAARSDRQLDALLDGLPLAGINAVAQGRGFAFRTDASTYPVDGRARITNFRDQGLDRRAQDGRLGLAQALTYSLNTWFAWMGELSDRSLLGRPAGGVPDLQPLEPGALDSVRPIVAMARRLGFGQALRLDGGLLPPDYPWSAWDALQATPAGIDPVHTRHELRQMAIGLRMQATPLQMALVAGAVGQGRAVVPHLLAQLDGAAAATAPGPALDVRLDRVRAGMKGVVDVGTAAGAFRAPALAAIRRGLSGKTGTAPLADGMHATVWFTGWLEPHSVPGQDHRLAVAVFVSRSEATGGEHAAPVAAAVLGALAAQTTK